MGRRELVDILEFAADYAAEMLGTGTHTSRVVRCTTRLVTSLGMNVEISTTLKHFIICVTDKDDNSVTRVMTVPTLPIGFERNADLSALSWHVYDQHLTLDEARRRYAEILQKPTMHQFVLFLLVGIANACFCHLFGGDIAAMAVVFVATVVGFATKTLLTRLGINHYIMVATSAFVASMCAASALLFDCTAQTAIATSPLFLIPGVPLINGLIDIMDSHVLVGISRLVSAMLTILCIAIGLSVTLLILKSQLL